MKEGYWKKIITLWFQGKRFKDHALEISALGELEQFQKLVTETAKDLWFAENPTRKNLPRHFEERTRLYLRGAIQEGSAGLCLEACAKPRTKERNKDLFNNEFEDIEKAADTVLEIYRSQERDEPLPKNLSQETLGDYAKFGLTLKNDETIKLNRANDPKPKFVQVTSKTGKKITRFIESNYVDHVDITGEVTAASVRQNLFELLLDDETRVEVNFTPVQEEQVTEALHMHHTIRVHVKGQGKRTPQGKLESVDQIGELNLQTVGETPYDETVKPIEEVLMELAKEIPEEEWDKLPKDGAENLDHYLYGTPKE